MAELPIVFTRAEALALGVTRGRLAGPRFRQVFTNVYTQSCTPSDLRVRTRAALHLAPPGAVAARHTAAALIGGVVPPTDDIQLSLPSGRLRVAGIDARRGRVEVRALARGIPVTSAEETFVALADHLGLLDLVVLGDSLVAVGRTTSAALVRAAERGPSHHSLRLRRAAGLVRAGVDSPMESRLRLLLVLAGLPEPVVNHTEYDDRGLVRRRFDLSYPALRVAVEYDGRQHAESRKQWEHDIARREGLDLDGWRLVVVLAKGIYREPGHTLDRVVRAIRDGGGDALVTSEEWRRHFGPSAAGA